MKAVLKKAGPARRHVTNLRMYGEIIGRKLGITIRSSNIATGATDGKVVMINHAAFSDDPDALVLLEGTCKHEFGHIRYTDFEAKCPILKRPLALSFYRALEDGRMEMCEKRDYPGMAVSIAAALDVMARKGLFPHPEDEEPVEHLFPNLLLGWTRSQYLEQKALEPAYLARRSMLCNLVGVSLLKRFLDVASDGLVRARCTKDVVACAIRLEELLKSEMEQQSGQGDSGSDDEPDENKTEQDGAKGDAGKGGNPDDSDPKGEDESPGSSDQDKGEPREGAQDGTQGDAAGGDSGDSAPQGEGDQPDGAGSDQGAQDGTQSDAAGGEPGDTGDSAPQSGGGPSDDAGSDAGDSTGSPQGSGDVAGSSPMEENPDDVAQILAQILGADDLPETDLGNLLQAAMDQTAPEDDWSEIGIRQASENAIAIAYYEALARQIELRVASHLEVLLESRVEERSRIECHGRKLSARHLVRVATTPTPRVFRNDEDISGVSTAVSVLLDVSASMETSLKDGVSRLHGAVASARAAVSAMDRNEVPCTLHFFGKYLTQVKSFDQAWRRVRNLHWYDTETSTMTAHAIERVAPELAVRQEERKLLLIVTDGVPDNPERACAALQSCAGFGVETALLLVNSEHPAERATLERFKQELNSYGISWIEVSSSDQLADGLMQAIRDAV